MSAMTARVDEPDALPGADPGASLPEFRGEVARIAKHAAEMDRAAAALAKAAERLEQAPRLVLDAAARVRELALQASALPDPAPLVEALEARARAAVDRAAARFGTALAAGLREKLPDLPELKATDEGYQSGAIRVRVDSGVGRVHVEYARLTVVKNVAYDPEAVAATISVFLSELALPPFIPETFLARLQAAYTLALAASGKAPGELVDVLGFHGHLAWVAQPDAFRREPTAKRFRDYPLHRFAHDLHRLRSLRRFEIGGKKLELEVAVHDRAYGKSLWVPDDRGSGSYYQAIGLR